MTDQALTSLTVASGATGNEILYVVQNNQSKQAVMSVTFPFWEMNSGVLNATHMGYNGLNSDLGVNMEESPLRVVGTSMGNTNLAQFRYQQTLSGPSHYFFHSYAATTATMSALPDGAEFGKLRFEGPTLSATWSEGARFTGEQDGVATSAHVPGSFRILLNRGPGVSDSFWFRNNGSLVIYPIVSAPPTPASGGALYVSQTGALCYRGSGGTITTVAPS